MKDTQLVHQKIITIIRRNLRVEQYYTCLSAIGENCLANCGIIEKVNLPV